jgi:hypothetical protein
MPIRKVYFWALPKTENSFLFLDTSQKEKAS